MNYTPLLPVVALVTTLAIRSANAQVPEGSKVRVKIAGELAEDGSVIPGRKSQSIRARLVAMETGHLILAMGDVSKTVRIPTTAVSQLEISRGRSRLKGALVGAIIGGAVGAAWGMAERSRACKQDPFLCDLSFVGPMVIAPSIGTIAGLVIGKPQWAKVP